MNSDCNTTIEANSSNQAKMKLVKFLNNGEHVKNINI
jgi:hypothetical protein